MENKKTCPLCMGERKLRNENHVLIDCTRCGGTGFVPLDGGPSGTGPGQGAGQ